MNPLLTKINKVFLRPAGLSLSNYSEEEKSQEYGACRFEIHGFKIISRNAKVTPTKVGQFVTIWKRKKEGPIEPYHESDSIDFVVINVEKEEQLGQFVFPKSVLCERGVFTTIRKEGKRGIRVYPAWDKPTSKTALRTQSWQLQHFVSGDEHGGVRSDELRMHYEM